MIIDEVPSPTPQEDAAHVEEEAEEDDTDRDLLTKLFALLPLIIIVVSVEESVQTI